MKEYEKFKELREAPHERMKFLSAEVERLTEATKQAKNKFQEAEGAGHESDALFASWQEIEHELKLNQAKLEAVASSIASKQHTKELEKAAYDLAESCHKDVKDLEKQKSTVIEELKDLQNQLFQKHYEIKQIQIQQRNIQAIVKQAREILPAIEPVSENYFLMVEQLPLATEEKVKRYINEKLAEATA